ncbi:MAG: hypothetical protein WBA74_07665, partial [Cyclobacteriaceae bacterium]
MKKVFLLTLSAWLFFQCTDENDPIAELSEEEAIAANFIAQGTSPLKSDPGFMLYFSQVLTQLRTQVPTVDLTNLTSSGGEITFATDSSFQALYGELEVSDESWKQAYDQAINLLLTNVNSNVSLRKLFPSEDEVVNDIEDLLEEEQVTDDSFKAYVASKMPVNTLYGKISTLEMQWLDNSGTTLDFSADPTNDYSDDEILTLLLNESSTANVSGASIDFQSSALLQRAG